MTSWTNDAFKETVNINGKEYRNCVIMRGWGCYSKDKDIDCRNCNIPLLFKEEAARYLKSKMEATQ